MLIAGKRSPQGSSTEPVAKDLVKSGAEYRDLNPEPVEDRLGSAS